MLGIHTRLSDLDFIDECYQLGLRVFQFHLQSPQTWNRPDVNKFNSFVSLAKSRGYKDLNLVFHGPFGLSVGKREHFKFALPYYKSFIEQASDYYNTIIVQHAGYLDKGCSVETGKLILSEFAWKLLQNNKGIKFTFENMAGAKTPQTQFMGSLKSLCDIVDNVNDSRFGITWDTEHSYANGFKMSNVSSIDYILKRAKLVHLNSVPSFVECGGHLDRHTDTLIKDGKCVDELKYVFNKACSLGIPMVLERKPSIVLQDVNWLLGGD